MVVVSYVSVPWFLRRLLAAKRYPLTRVYVNEVLVTSECGTVPTDRIMARALPGGELIRLMGCQHE